MRRTTIVRTRSWTWPRTCGRWMMIVWALAVSAAAPRPALSETILTFGTANVNEGILPLQVAIDRGFLKAEGLGAAFVSFQGGGPAVQAFVGGSIDFCVCAADHVLRLANRGFDARIVVDMQNYFVAAGYPNAISRAREIVPNINRLADAVRAAGGTVAWIQTTSTGSLEHWKNHLTDSMSAERLHKRQSSLVETADGFRIYPELVVADDLRFTKVTYSAFVPSPAAIDLEFRRRGIAFILIAGAATNVCSETTARHAATFDYRVVMVSDANATWTDAEHAATLDNFMLFFGDVMPTDEAISRLCGSNPSRP